MVFVFYNDIHRVWCRADRLLVLGIDTATWTAAVGVARDGVVLPRSRSRTTGAHAAVAAAADRATRSPGPGSASATSTRSRSRSGRDRSPVSASALGLAKGLAFARGLPLVGVPTLEALAHAAEAPAGSTRVRGARCPQARGLRGVLPRDGRRGPRATRVPTQRWRPPSLAARLPSDVVLVGDAADAYPEAFAPIAARLPFATRPSAGRHRAPHSGPVRWRRGSRRRSRATLEPRYVRPPEAELPAERATAAGDAR